MKLTFLRTWSSPIAVHAEHLRLAYEQTWNGGNEFSLMVDNLQVKSGTIHCIYGTNGSGKTTLLRAIVGLVEPREGRLFWEPEGSLVPGTDYVLVPSTGPMPHWNVCENIEAPLRNLGIERTQIQERVAELVSLLGLEELGNRHAHQLSTGQQQRTVLARALGLSPRVLLLDEIMSGQSEYWANSIANVLRTFADNGSIILMISHDPEWVMQYADSVTHIVSHHDEGASSVQFFVGFDGNASEWTSFRKSRYGVA